MKQFKVFIFVLCLLPLTLTMMVFGQERAELATRVLVFSKTAGFRHSSIPDGLAMIEQLGSTHGFGVDSTEDGGAFTDENLAQYDAVIFLMTTGDVLNDEQQGAFERYIQNGGGYVGIHSASDTEYSWPWYGELVGAYFDNHPAIQTATIDVEDNSHLSTAHLPAEWVRNDEWYNFQSNPRVNVNVLLTLDETSYEGGTMGDDHPIAWYHEFDGGRAWYTGGGHTSESYSEPDFVQHVWGGIQYATQFMQVEFDNLLYVPMIVGDGVTQAASDESVNGSAPHQGCFPRGWD